MPPSGNTRLGRYEILSALGAGGMGEVYLAWDSELERTVALKVLPSDVATDQLRMSRFIQEAKAVSALNHQNILTIYEIGQVDGTLFIATEFIEGVTLRQHMQSTQMNLGELLDVTTQVATALSAAHQAGIIHRDIKPENIMVRGDGHIKVLDFGLVKLTKQQLAAVDTQAPTKALLKTTPGAVMGTVLYMSPEQARGLDVDARTDIWSLGVVLYEMTTGRRPFEGNTNTDVIVSILEREPPPLAHYVPEAPVELQRIISQALVKDREERYQAVKDLLLDLKHLKQELEFAAKLEDSALPATDKKTTATVSSKQPTVEIVRRPLKILAAAVLLIGLIVFAGYYFWHTRTGPTAPSASLIASQQSLVSTFQGSHTAASFSPGGDRIAFLNEVNGVTQVWVKRLAGGDPVQLTFDKDPAGRPRWSPAGNEIVYVRHTPGKASIYSVSPEGGEPRKIIEGGRNPNWFWDGARLVFERGYDVWTTNMDGSDQRRIENVPPTDFLAADRMPALSPDGSLIAIFQNDKGPIGDYWVVPISGGEARRLTFDHTFSGAPVWTEDGRFIIFPSRRAGSMTLWKVPAAGGSPESVLMSAGEDTEPEISRDGRKLIYTNTRSSHTLMLTDAATLQSRELRESRVEMVNPSFSFDGSRIVFFGINEEGDIHIYTVGTDGKNLTQVTRGKKERNIHPHFSADGSTIYFYQFHPSVSFRKVSAHGGESTELVQGWEWGTHNGARVDPEGKRIIYSKMDKGSAAATMIRDIASGVETAFSLPLRQMRWSYDGRFVVGTDIPGRNWELAEITVCAVDGEACHKVTKGYTPNWSHDDARIYFFTFTDAGGESLWVVSREGGDEKKIMDLRPMHPLGNFFDVSPQDQIVWVRYKEGKHELWLADLVKP